MMSIAFRWSKNASKNSGKPGTNAQREQSVRRQRQFERVSDMDAVTLADGSVKLVRRASLVAAKDLLAAQKAAERRVAERQRAMLWLAATEIADTLEAPMVADRR